MHVTADETGLFTYICIQCGIEKLDTDFEPTGMSEVCLDCGGLDESI